MCAATENPAVIDGVRRALESGDRSARRLVPPIARRSGRRVILETARRHPQRVIHDAFENPLLAPWRLGLSDIGAYAAGSGAWRRLVGAENGHLHGPLLRLLFGVCLLAEPGHAARVCRTLIGHHVRAIDLMVRRLERDWGGARVVRALETLASDPHRGGNRNVRVTLRRGESWVYKARPVDVESLLFGANSMASSVNRLLRAESRPECLPRLVVKSGSGRDAAHYGYIGWVDAQPLMRVFRDRRVRMQTVRLEEPDSASLWRDAGALAAFAHAFGVGDLHASNLVVAGTKGGRPRHHVIDAEVAASPVCDLDQTLLTRGDIRHGAPGHIHSGYEPEVLPCGNEDHRWVFFRERDAWRLRPVPPGLMPPDQYPSLVVDRRGRIGYRPYLGSFLDGLVGAWDVIVRHRHALGQAFANRLEKTAVRQILRDTSFYGGVLRKALLGRDLAWTRLSAAEAHQIASFDVPYFFSKGGALLYYHEYPEQVRRVPRSATRPLAGNVLVPRRVNAFQIGILVHDAIRHVLPTGARVRIEDPRIRLERRPPQTRLAARVRNAEWVVRLHDKKRFAMVTVEPSA